MMKLLSVPHRPYFFLGIINLPLSMLFFALSWNGVIMSPVSSTLLHPFLMLFTVFPFFIFGFLLTVFPRFLGVDEIDSFCPSVFAAFFSLLLIYGGLFGSWEIYFIGVVTLLINYFMIFKLLYHVYISSYLKDKKDVLHLLLLHGVGIFGLSLYTYGLFYKDETLMSLSFWCASHLYVVLLFFTILQRMLPFFSSSVQGYTPIRPHNITPFLLVGMIIEKWGDFFHLIILNGCGLLIQAICVLYLLFRWKLPFENAPSILTVLYSGILWYAYITSYHAIYLLCSEYMALPALAFNHGIYIGFIVTIVAGFSTRVIRGHGGQAIMTDQVAKFLFTMVFLIAVARISVDYFLPNEPSHYMNAITLLTGVWSLSFTIWGVRYSRWLLF